MRASYQRLLNRWLGLSKKSHYAIYFSLFLLISCFCVMTFCYQLMRLDMQQKVQCNEKEAKLLNVQAQVEGLKTVHNLYYSYQQRVPQTLVIPKSVSLYQSQIMTQLQQQSQALGIHNMDIKLQKCRSNKVEKTTLYCDIFVMFDAAKESVGNVIENTLLSPWLLTLKESALRISEEHLIHANITFTLILPQDLDHKKYTISEYKRGLQTPEIYLDHLDFQLGFFPSIENIEEPIELKPTASASLNEDEEIMQWHFNGILKKRNDLTVHLNHELHGDIWLHKGEYLIDSKWYLLDIRSDTLEFVHELSKQHVQIHYTGKFL